jgi:hypothetical protein
MIRDVSIIQFDYFALDHVSLSRRCGKAEEDSGSAVHQKVLEKS